MKGAIAITITHDFLRKNGKKPGVSYLAWENSMPLMGREAWRFRCPVGRSTTSGSSPRTCSECLPRNKCSLVAIARQTCKWDGTPLWFLLTIFASVAFLGFVLHIA